jgi:hypothetical protein
MRSASTAILIGLSFLPICPGPLAGRPFIRADSNTDGAVDISDAIATLTALFLEEAALPCLSAADSNDDGTVDISDAIKALTFLFLGGDANIPPPGPFTCGEDPTADSLSCDAFPSCAQLPLVRIQGRLVLEDGMSATGAAVAAFGSFQGASATADANGAFDLTLDFSDLLAQFSFLQTVRIFIQGHLDIGGVPYEATQTTVEPATAHVTDLGTIVLRSSPTRSFIRGDANSDGSVDVSDEIFIGRLVELYLANEFDCRSTALIVVDAGDSLPRCLDAADINDDGYVNALDIVALRNAFFCKGFIPSPTQDVGCGPDPTPDALGCAEYPCQ